MEIVVGGRGTGRTTTLCKWLMQGKPQGNAGWSRVILVANDAQRRWCLQTLHEVADNWSHEAAKLRVLALLPELVMLTGQARSTLRGQKVEIAVDNLDDVLISMFGQLPEAVSTTGQVTLLHAR